jgi:hypothetical protein
MATVNISSYGGRASGGSQVQVDSIERRTAINPFLDDPSRKAGGDDVIPLPVLDAAAMDQLFGIAVGQANNASAPASRETGDAGGTATVTSLDTIGPASQSANALNREAYKDLGWNLGWNTTGTGVSRGAAAFGLKENPSYYRESETGEIQPQGNKYANLDKIAEFAKIDPDQFKNADGTTNEDALKSAVDEALKDYYRVSGDIGGIPGQTAKPFEFASAIYKRDGDKLTAVPGTQQRFMAPENSAGHFAEELAAPLSVLAAPILGGLGITGTAGSLTGAISNATGLSPFWSNALGQAGIRGTMSAASGGSFGRGAVSGAVGAVAPTFIGQGANSLAGPGTGGATVLNLMGRLGLSAALNGGNLSPMAVVGTLVDTLGGKSGSRTRTRTSK